MSAQIKKSFVWVWMFALLTATVGISMHQIYCYCAGMRSVSFFAATSTCQAELSQPKAVVAPLSCCAKKVISRKSCCEKGDADAKKKHGCTKKTTRFFQLKAKFIQHESRLENLVSSPLDLPVIPVFQEPHVRTNYTQTPGIQSFPNPPPPLSGRIICLRHCIARC